MIYSLPYLSVSSAIKRLQYILTIEVLSRVFPPTSKITKESNPLLDMRKLSSHQGSIAHWALCTVREGDVFPLTGWLSVLDILTIFCKHVALCPCPILDDTSPACNVQNNLPSISKFALMMRQMM